MSIQAVRAVVENNDKQRLALGTDESGRPTIRANQGHTVKVVDSAALLTRVTDAAQCGACVHGTTRAAWRLIRTSGLCRMARNHVHMALGTPEDGGVISGARATSQVFVFLDARKMLAHGLPVWLSANKVVLCAGEGERGVIAPAFFDRAVDANTGEELALRGAAAQPPPPPPLAAAAAVARAASAPAPAGAAGAAPAGAAPAVPVPEAVACGSREIRAAFDERTARVYQAYSAEIAEAAVQAQAFVAPWKPARMNWVKPSFAWMGYRCGWGAKDKGQARVLAVDLTREGFDALLLRAARGDARVAPGGAGLEPPRAAAAAGQAKQRFERRSECGERHYRAVGPGGRPGHRRRPARAG